MNLDELTQCFGMLGLEPGATIAQVKEAYRNSLQAFHPDKFPEGSSSQKWAADRLIVVKDAYEKLQEFFKENMTGEPPGGWPGKAKAGADSDPEDGSMDWQAWETQQQGSFSEEVKAWEKRQAERETVKLDEHGKIRRSKMLTFGKCAVGAILAMLWMGKCSNNQWENANRAAEAADWKARWDYQIQTSGTASSSSVIDPRVLAGQAKDEAQKLTEKWSQEDSERNIGLVLMWVMTGGLAWLFFAKRPKNVLQNWVNTGQADWKELKAAAKDAAATAASKAKIVAESAAKKAVETAEKLRENTEKPTEAKQPTEKKPPPSQQDIMDAYNRIKEQERQKKEKGNDP